MDIDNRIDFWLKGIPYVWVPNDNINKCRRYYLLSDDTALFTFDKHGNSFTVNRKAIRHETSSGLTFSPFKFRLDEYNTARKYFLVWVKHISSVTHEIRIEGKITTSRKRVSTTRPKIMLDGVLYKKIEINKHSKSYAVMLIELDEEPSQNDT